MKKTLALILAGGFTAAQALAVNITVQDPNRGGTPFVTETSGGWYKGDDGPGGNAAFVGTPPSQTAIQSEYEEVEPGMATGKVWDLVAFTVDTSNIYNQKLGILSSYNLKLGEGGFASGDVFISVNPSQVQSYLDGTNFGPTSQNNGSPGLYDFALRMNFNTGKYSVYQLTANTIFENTYYDSQNYNAPSNPWKIQANTANYLFDNNLSFTNGTLSDTQASAYAEFGVSGVGYYAEFQNMAWLTPYLDSNNPVSYFHFTMECGNDNLVGSYSTGFKKVPEQATTLVLLGLALLGLPMARRFRS